MLALSLHRACIAIGLALGAKDLQSSVQAYLRGFFPLEKQLFIFIYIFSVLGCSHTGDHPQEEVAKFGYKSEKKVEKFKES
jgi:hypothetical protein